MLVTKSNKLNFAVFLLLLDQRHCSYSYFGFKTQAQKLKYFNVSNEKALKIYTAINKIAHARNFHLIDYESS